MNAPRLRLDRIAVRHMPGFRRTADAFDVEGLSPGLNLIHGPNGCGKTTLARAIQALFWPPDDAPSCTVEGTLACDGTDWRIEVDGSRRSCSRDGKPADPPALPGSEWARCYTLALQDLLRVDDHDFAAAMAREAAGGYSVAAASEALHLRPGPSRPTRETRDFEQAQEAYEAAVRVQRNLADEATALRHDEEALHAAQRAGVEGTALELAIAWRREVENACTAAEQLAAFPPAVSRLAANELDTAADMERTLTELDRNLAATRRDIEHARRDLDTAGPAAAAMDESLLGAASARSEQLGVVEADLRALAQRLAAAHARTAAARRTAAADADDSTLAARHWDGTEWPRLERLALRAAELNAERKACEAMEDWLSPPSAAQNTDALRDAVGILSRLLRIPDPAPWRQTAAVMTLVALVLGLAAAWGALHINTAALILLAPAAAGAMAAVRLWRATLSSRETQALREAYALTNQPPPADWSAASVAGTLDGLCARLGQARLEDARERLREEVLAPRVRRAEEAARALAEERERLVAELGLSPDMTDGRMLDLVGAVVRWQAAVADEAAAAAELSAAQTAKSALLESVGDFLRPFNLPPPTDAASAAAAIQAVGNRCRQASRARDAEGAAVARHEELQRQQGEWNDRRRGLFQRLGLRDGDGEGLAALARQRDACLAASDEARRTEGARAAAERRLREHPAFVESICVRPVQELQDDYVRTRRQAEAAEAIQERVTRLKERLDQARREHAMEEALARFERAHELLIERREADYAAAVGHVLARHVERLHAETDLPAVFRRARDLALDVTAGACRLTLERGDGQPEFRVVETVSGATRRLDELSSGTRVQILLCVRLACAERQESGLPPPFFADELLANSDDARADAVIGALLAVCRSGRQVFCFTAQQDEAAKWLRALSANPDIPSRVIDLPALRRGETAEQVAAQAPSLPPPPAVPAPGGMDHAAYGRLLRPDPIDPMLDAAGIHLWHLVDDTATLHKLLASGVERWGQLEAFVDRGGHAFFDGDTGALRRARALARAAQAACEAARIGRGRRLNAVDISDGAFISGAFLDRTVEILKEVNGDAAAFLVRLGALPRFRKENAAALREWLVDQGFLASEPPLSGDELRRRVRAAAAADLAAGHLSDADVERVLAGLAH